MGTPFWDLIPTSIQTLVGVAAILGAGWTWFVRPRMVTIVVEAITQSSKDLRKEMNASTGKLREEIARVRKNLSEDIAANRASITKVREMIHTSRIETRDLLAEMRQENHQAHEAIGERLNDMRTDTAKLAGAVDILTAVVRGRRDPGETWTP